MNCDQFSRNTDKRGIWCNWGLGLLTALCLALAGPSEAQDWSIPDGVVVPSTQMPAGLNFDFDKPVEFFAIMENAISLNEALKDRRPNIENLALSLMLDPEGAFAFFRNQIRTVSYRGRSRDTDAVLEAGAGNDHDKAVGLSALLSLIGYDSGLVSAPMPAEMAAKIEQGACGGAGDSAPEIWRLVGLPGNSMARVAQRAQTNFGALSVVIPEGTLHEMAPGGVNSEQP